MFAKMVIAKTFLAVFDVIALKVILIHFNFEKICGYFKFAY